MAKAAALIRPRWTLTLSSSGMMAEELGLIGCWVPPRHGPIERTKRHKEDYILRRLLAAWRLTKALSFPLEIQAATDEPGRPDFVLVFPDGTARGVEAVEAGEESRQRWLTKTSADREAGKLDGRIGEVVTMPTAQTADQYEAAIRLKIGKHDQGAYRDPPECDLVVYDNTEWGGYLDKRPIIQRLRQSNELRGRFRQLHLVLDSLVYLDVLGDEHPFLDVSQTYEIDYAAWTFDQAERLRRLTPDLADAELIAEEIESLGRSERREVDSRLEILLLHLLKWQLQPERRSRSWRLTIEEARERLQERLMESLSLRRCWDSLADRYKVARRAAAAETGVGLESVPDTCPYSNEQIIDPDFLPGSTDDHEGEQR